MGHLSKSLNFLAIDEILQTTAVNYCLTCRGHIHSACGYFLYLGRAIVAESVKIKVNKLQRMTVQAAFKTYQIDELYKWYKIFRIKDISSGNFLLCCGRCVGQFALTF